MDFKKYLDETAAELDREVGKILEEQLSEATKIDKKLAPLIKAFTDSCQGGKRIRGALVKLGYELVAEDGRLKSVDILKIGAAYEIFHTAILVHDDIIDKSIMRRDKPSLHQALGGNHYGISQAISLGDYGFFLSYKIICETGFPGDSKIKALTLFSKIMMNTAWGQMLDLENTDPIIVMKFKTARYTIFGPLQIGALLGGTDEKQIKIIGDFGENLGIAYQIQDDILDSETRSLEKAKKEAEDFKNKAMKVLPQVTEDKIMSKLLAQMADYLVERTK